MSVKSSLRVDWCNYEAAKYAVEHWHYSRSISASKKIMVGAWENEKFIGAVIFGWGANNNLASPFGLEMVECCELTRVALDNHLAPASKIVAYAVRLLRKQSPGLRLIVSYADTRHNHHGGLYQAMNWIYAGVVKSTPDYFVENRWMHQRQMNSIFGTVKGFTGIKRAGSPKHKYLMPLDGDIRKRILLLSKPYPKRESCATSKDGVAPGDQSGEGGSTPTVALIRELAEP